MKITTWISNIISGILIVLLVSVLGLTVSAKMADGNPGILGHELLVVLSGSMEPDIQTGSIIAIEPAVNIDAYNPGDVITYYSVDNPDTLVTHRIVDVELAGNSVEYITKGDNNNAIDSSSVPAQNVIGHYANFTVPYAGYVLEFANSTAGIIIMLIVPGVILMISAMVQVYKAIAHSNDEDEKDRSDKKAVGNDVT